MACVSAVLFRFRLLFQMTTKDLTAKTQSLRLDVAVVLFIIIRICVLVRVQGRAVADKNNIRVRWQLQSGT